jgi:hypothetical protein
VDNVIDFINVNRERYLEEVTKGVKLMRPLFES